MAATAIQATAIQAIAIQATAMALTNPIVSRTLQTAYTKGAARLLATSVS